VALHTVAEHILGAASYAAVGHIGLRANESGFATQDLNGRTFTVSGPCLTDGERSLALPGSTLRGVADWAQVVPGAPATVYTPTTPLDLETPLQIDAECAVMLGEWFAGMQIVLTSVFPNETIQLWPEHFDLATSVNEANFGASPGDSQMPEPYLYFGPWGGGFTPMPFSELTKAGDPLAAAEGFFQRGKRLFG
jgi:hypothetical protein